MLSVEKLRELGKSTPVPLVALVANYSFDKDKDKGKVMLEQREKLEESPG